MPDTNVSDTPTPSAPVDAGELLNTLVSAAKTEEWTANFGTRWKETIAATEQAKANISALIEHLTAENAELKSSVIAFAGPWAAQYARDYDLPAGHLHPTHYDLLEKCGARMVDFTRAALPEQGC